jgi:hypothetical protein
MRLPPLSGWILAAMGKEAGKIDSVTKYRVLHGAATRITGAIHNLFAVSATTVTTVDQLRRRSFTVAR